MVEVPPELWDEYANEQAERAHYPHPHEYEVDSTQPDPTHECTACGETVCIESEPRTRTTHWCESCDSLKPHQKV